MRKNSYGTLVMLVAIGLLLCHPSSTHATSLGAIERPCRITLRLPTDARIFINGDRYSAQEGQSVRTYVTHPVTPKSETWYNLRAEITRNDRVVREELDLDISAALAFDETMLAEFQPEASAATPTISPPFSYSKRHDNSDGSVSFIEPTMMYTGLSLPIRGSRESAHALCRGAGFSRAVDHDTYSVQHYITGEAAFRGGQRICDVAFENGRLRISGTSWITGRYVLWNERTGDAEALFFITCDR